MSISDFEDMEIVAAIWHLIAPNNAGEGGIAEGVSERSVLVALAEQVPGFFDNGTPGRRDVRDIHDRLVELVEKGKLVDAAPGWRTPLAPEDALYRLTMQGEKHTYSFRGSQEHAAKETCATVSDLTGYRADYIEAMFVAPIKPGKARKIGNERGVIKFIIERTV